MLLTDFDDELNVVLLMMAFPKLELFLISLFFSCILIFLIETVPCILEFGEFDENKLEVNGAWEVMGVI